MIRFNDRGSLEICIEHDEYMPIERDCSVSLRLFPVPMMVELHPAERTVTVSMEWHGIQVMSTYIIDRANRSVDSGSGASAPSLREWSYDFFNFIGYAS